MFPTRPGIFPSQNVTTSHLTGTPAAFRPYPFINDDYFDARGLSGSVPQRVAHALISTSTEILPDLLDIARAADEIDTLLKKL